MWLRVVFLCFAMLFPSGVVGQPTEMLSLKGKTVLHYMYHPSQVLDQVPLSPTESGYFRTYQFFIEFVALEKAESALQFMQAYDQFTKVIHQGIPQQKNWMLANLSIQKGLIQWMQNEPLAGTVSFIQGHRLLKEAFKSPALQLEAQKLRALYLILIDQLPDYLMSGAHLFGLEGNRKEGFHQLREYVKVCEGKAGIHAEALVLYGYCLLKFSPPDDHQTNLFFQWSRRSTSPLVAFVSASLALKERDGALCRRLLDALPPESYDHFPLLYHLKGKAQLNHLSHTCEEAFLQFFRTYPGMSFKADAHLRLARYYRISGDTAKVRGQMEAIQALATFPTSNDKQAVQEVFSVSEKPVALIKARLLFDDGHNSACIQQLKTMDESLLSDFYRAEWYYRLARALEVDNRFTEALFGYQQVIRLADEDVRYFGPYSALNAANIHLETLKDTAACQKMLELARELNTGQYKSDIKRKISDLASKLDK